jgi:16S rRNA processing protein RimM
MTARGYASVGRVRRAHGIRGELVIELLTGDPEAIFAPGRRVLAGTADGRLWLDPETGAARPCTVLSSRPFKDGLLVTIEGISDRTEAERWRGRHLLAPFSELTPPADGEVYLHELEGMRVLDAAGAEIGVVTAWNQLPNGILLDVSGARGAVQVPFNEAFVRAVDRSARRLTVEIPDELYTGGT